MAIGSGPMEGGGNITREGTGVFNQKMFVLSPNNQSFVGINNIQDKENGVNEEQEWQINEKKVQEEYEKEEEQEQRSVVEVNREAFE